MATWTVMVGNVGVVHSGKSELDAREVFKKYKIKSLTNEGRAGGEPVVMLKDGEEYSVHETPEVLKNPRSNRTAKKFAKKAVSGVKKAATHAKKAASSLKGHLVSLHSKLKKNPTAPLAETLAERLISSYDSPEKLLSIKTPKKIVDKVERLGQECSSEEEAVWELTAFLNQNYSQEQIKSMLETWRRNVIGSGYKRNPPNRAGDMAAFEYDVVGNPPFVMHSVLAKKRAATRNPAEDSVDARALLKKIKDLQRELKEQEAAEKAMKKVLAAAKKTKSRAKPKTKRVPASQLSAKPKKASASQLSAKPKKASASQLSTKTKSRAKPKTKFTPEQRAARAEKLALTAVRKAIAKSAVRKAIAKAKKSSMNTED